MIQVGRPKLLVDFAIVLHLRDRYNLGWSRIAQSYRYLAAKAKLNNITPI
jgi:hypothetical protein